MSDTVEQALAAIAQRTGWETWIGVTGILGCLACRRGYARRQLAARLGMAAPSGSRACYRRRVRPITHAIAAYQATPTTRIAPAMISTHSHHRTVPG